MSRIPALLSQLAVLHRQQVEIEHQIVEIERAIVTIKNESKPRRRSANLANVAELAKPLLRILTDAGEPLPRAELAARLGIEPSQVTYRLQRALEAKLIERLIGGRYRVAEAVRAAFSGAAQ